MNLQSDIELLNLEELNQESLMDIEGGDWRKKVWDHTIGWVIGEVIDGVGRGLTQPCTCK